MLMRDSVNASLIPTDTPVVAGYGDGAFIWSSADWARFPNSIPLSIVVNAADVGDILDVENLDATPADVPGWIDRFNRPNRRLPTIYCNRSTIAEVRAAVGSRQFDWWAATLDGTQNVAGAVAVQYLDAGGYDESIILDESWVTGKGGSVTVQDTVVPSSPVSGKIFQNAQWYDWNTLGPLQTTDQTGSTGDTAAWCEAKLVDGIWYLHICPGSWALKDSDFDDGGHDPTYFRPAPPAPTPPPVDDDSALEARVAALESTLAKIKAALS